MCKFYGYLLGSFFLLALFAPLLSPYNPSLIELSNIKLPPNLSHWLGTDLLGRDILSRILYAMRTSLCVGIASAGLSIIFACCFLILSELFAPLFFQRILDLLLAIPSLLLIMFFQSFFPGGFISMTIVIALGHCIYIAKVLKSELIRLKKLDFCECAITLGSSKIQVIFKELLPCCINLIITLFILNIAHGIGSEATLSFFGLGGEDNIPSLGNMLSDSSRALLIGAWWIILFPTLSILFLIFSLLNLSDALRDRFGIKI